MVSLGFLALLGVCGILSGFIVFFGILSGGSGSKLPDYPEQPALAFFRDHSIGFFARLAWLKPTIVVGLALEV